MSASRQRAIRLLEIPPGAPGVDAARRMLDDILSGSDTVWAPVTNLGAAEDVLHPDVPVENPRTRLILLTSGSTGDPKGVCLSREALEANATLVAQRHPDLADAPRVVALPVTSAGGLGVVARAILSDSETVTVPSIGGGGRFTPDMFCDAVAPVLDQGPVVSLVPTQLAVLMEDARALDVLARMRRVLLGGAAAPAELLRRAHDRGVDAVVTYGMTETCGGCVHDGRPLDGVEVRVDTGGRIHLMGPMVADGYRLRPEETSAAFGSHEFHTEDIGAWRDGRLRVLGRIDDIVQVKGVNVGLSAVEHALLEHPLIQDAIVIAVADDRDGSRLIACVVLAPTPADDAVTLAQIRDHVRARLGSPAVPHDVRQVSVLPYLPNGKIDRLTVQRHVIDTTPPR
jgi:o-succinylbenzoate---CoA ligase